MRTETVPVVTADGLTLAADLVLPSGPVRGAAVVCHPHPLYGGDRHNPVVGTLVEALAGAGLATVRFDFRGAGGSPGAHDHGRAERLDVEAVLDAAWLAAGGPVPAARPPDDPGPAGADGDPVLAAAFPDSVAPPRRTSLPPVVLAGYSFGALMALSVVDPRITAWLAVAPPLRPGDPELPAAADPRPKHLLVPAHDQFAPPPRVREVVAAWAAASVADVPMADHFLAGAHRFLAAESTSFAVALLPPA